jgi:hypothetical protein
MSKEPKYHIGFSREDMGENPPTLAMLRHLMGRAEFRIQEAKNKSNSLDLLATGS